MALYKTCGKCQTKSPITSMRCKCGQPLPAYRPSNQDATSFSAQASSTEDVRTEPRITLTPPRQRQAQHYVARYWRGELSLAHSFWLTNMLVDIALGIMQQLLANRQETTASPLLVHQVLTAIKFLHMFVISPWQMVGLWRAARNSLATGCGRLWGRCTQGIVVLGLVVTLITVPFWVPAYTEMAKVALRTEAYRYTVSLSPDGNMLRVEGGIGLGLAQAVAQQLRTHPGVEVVGLSSQGGLLGEARKLQALIERRGLSTYAVDHCQSACTNIFLAGSQRMLHKDAQLGFHRGHIPGLPDMMAQGENDLDKRYMLAHGVAQPFVDKAMGTPAYEMWTPTTEELVQAGVVTDIVDGTQIVTRPRFLTIGTVQPASTPTTTRTIVAFLNSPGGLSLELSGFHTDADEMKADGRRYLMATHPQTGVIVSVTLERGPSAASRQGCVAHLAQLKNGPFVVRGHDVTFDTASAIPRLEYTIAETQGVHVEQRNVRTCLAQGNTYADIHLSKVLYKAAEAPLFDRVLSTIQLIDDPAQRNRPAPGSPASSLELFKKGSVYYLQNRYTQAIPFYQQAVDLEKASPQLEKTYWRVLVDNLGMAYGLTGRLADAKATFEYGVSIDAQYPMFYYNLACTYAEMQADAEAIRALKTAFRYRHNVNAGEQMPDPRTDSSFQRLMGRPDFRTLVDRLMARRS